MSEAQPLQILLVCTGNICRSPVAELLLAHRASELTGISVGSAGTRGVVGSPVHGPMAELLSDAGVDPVGFAARQLNRSMIKRADLVLTMEVEHSEFVVAMEPLGLRKTATLLQLAGWLEEVSREAPDRGNQGAGLRELAGAAMARRLAGKGLETELINIADPYGRDSDAYSTAFELINTATSRIIEAFDSASSKETAPRA